MALRGRIMHRSFVSVHYQQEQPGLRLLVGRF